MQANIITHDPHTLGEYSRQQNEETFFALVWLVEQINNWLSDFTDPFDKEQEFDVSIYNFDPNALYLELFNNGININDHTEIPSVIDGLIEDFKSVNLDTAKLEEFAVIYRAIS